MLIYGRPAQYCKAIILQLKINKFLKMHMYQKKKKVSAIQAEEKKWEWRVVIDNKMLLAVVTPLLGQRQKKENTVCSGNTFLQEMYFQWFYIKFIVRTVGIIKIQASLLFFAIDSLYILDFFIP